MAYQFNPASAPVYTPNRFDKGAGYLDDGVSSNSGYGTADELFINPDPHGTDLGRAPYVVHPEDDDFGQAGILYREVMDDGAKDRLAHNITNAMVGVSRKPSSGATGIGIRLIRSLAPRCGSGSPPRNNPPDC